MEKTEAIDHGSDWVINTDLINIRQDYFEDIYQVDSDNKTCSQVVKDILSFYNLRLDDYYVKDWDYQEKYWKEHGKNYSIVNNNYLQLKSVKYAKIPSIIDYQGGSRIAFFANYKNLDYNSDPIFYLLIFYEKDGLVSNFNWVHIGYSMYRIPIINSQYNIEYNWINNMTGRSFRDSSAIIRDFNGDGYDEIMTFYNDIEGTIFCSIYDFYDENGIEEDIKPIFQVPLEIFIYPGIEKWVFGPPIQFGTYKGIKGFVIYEDVPISEIAKHYANMDMSDPLFDDWYKEFRVKGNIWNFYAWDKEEKKYIFIDRVNPDEIKTQWAKIIKNRENFKN